MYDILIYVLKAWTQKQDSFIGVCLGGVSSVRAPGLGVAARVRKPERPGFGRGLLPELDLRNDSLRLGKDAGMLRQQFERGPGIFLLTDRGVSVGKSPTLPPATQK